MITQRRFLATSILLIGACAVLAQGDEGSTLKASPDGGTSWTSGKGPSTAKGKPTAGVDARPFVGRWRIEATEGAYFMTLTDKFDGWATNVPSAVLKWEIVGDEARVTWSHGWRNILRPREEKSIAFAPGLKWTDKPTSTVRAVKDEAGGGLSPGPRSIKDLEQVVTVANAAETLAEKSRADAEALAQEWMKEKGLSVGERSFVTRHGSSYSRARPVWPDLKKPSLNVSKPLEDGDIGVPYYPARLRDPRRLAGTSANLPVVQILGDEEMVVGPWNMCVRGISTTGLVAGRGGSTVDLEGLYWVDGTKTIKHTSGKIEEMPCLTALDPKKIDSALDNEKVKRWLAALDARRDAKIQVKRAAEALRKAEAAQVAELAQRKRDEERRRAEVEKNAADAQEAMKAKTEAASAALKGKIEAARAARKAARKAEEEYDKNGLVLLRKTVEEKAKGSTFVITGKVVNRRAYKIGKAYIEFDVYDAGGARIGTARATIKNLAANDPWNFTAVYRGRNGKSSKISDLGGS